MSLAKKLGMNSVPWFRLTCYVLGIYSLLTCLVMFFRTDFINLTVCTVAIYMMMNTDKIRKWTFRMLVMAIILSMVYDVIWVIMIQDFSSERPEDGGLEKTVRNFSLKMSLVSLVFRVLHYLLLDLGDCPVRVLEGLH